MLKNGLRSFQRIRQFIGVEDLPDLPIGVLSRSDGGTSATLTLGLWVRILPEV